MGKSAEMQHLLTHLSPLLSLSRYPEIWLPPHHRTKTPVPKSAIHPRPTYKQGQGAIAGTSRSKPSQRARSGEGRERAREPGRRCLDSLRTLPLNASCKRKIFEYGIWSSELRAGTNLSFTLGLGAIRVLRLPKHWV